MFRKLVAVGTTAALTLAMGVSVFAADAGINADEQRVLDQLKAKAVPEKYINQAKDALAADGVDVSKADADVAIANIDKAKELAGTKSIAEIKADKNLYDQIKALVNETAALKTINVKVSWDTTSGAPSIVAGTTNNVKGNDDKIKGTGVDFSTTAAVVAGLGLSIAGLAVVAKKKDLVNA